MKIIGDEQAMRKKQKMKRSSKQSDVYIFHHFATYFSQISNKRAQTQDLFVSKCGHEASPEVALHVAGTRRTGEGAYE